MGAALSHSGRPDVALGARGADQPLHPLRAPAHEVDPDFTSGRVPGAGRAGSRLFPPAPVSTSGTGHAGPWSLALALASSAGTGGRTAYRLLDRAIGCADRARAAVLRAACAVPVVRPWLLCLVDVRRRALWRGLGCVATSALIALRFP